MSSESESSVSESNVSVSSVSESSIFFLVSFSPEFESLSPKAGRIVPTGNDLL